MKTSLKPLFYINTRNRESRSRVNACISKCVDLFKCFTNQGLLQHAKTLHAHLTKIGISSDKYLSVMLLNMYSSFNKPSEAAHIFKLFDGFNVVLHNHYINANLKWGEIEVARKVFDEMPDRNEVSWTVLISGLLRLGLVEDAACYIEMNPFQDLVTSTAVITGLVRNGLSFKAMEVFRGMLGCGVMPNSVTFLSVLRGCGELGDFELGMCIAGFITKVGLAQDISVCNALITFCLRVKQFDLAIDLFNRMESRDVVSYTAILDVYIESGYIRGARRIFEKIPDRNEASWRVMIAGYCESGDSEEAAKLFRRMVVDGFNPNSSCISYVMRAVAILKALAYGMNIHGLVVKTGREGDVFIGTALIDLYCNCGETEDARAVFDSISDKNVDCWNSMVAGYSLNGELEEASEVYDRIPVKNEVSRNLRATFCNRRF